MFKEFLVLPLTYGAINELQKPLFYSSQVPFIYFYFYLLYVCLARVIFVNLFYYLIYFYYYL